jgi:hypothetical protein
MTMIKHNPLDPEEQRRQRDLCEMQKLLDRLFSMLNDYGCDEMNSEYEMIRERINDKLNGIWAAR